MLISYFIVFKFQYERCPYCLQSRADYSHHINIGVPLLMTVEANEMVVGDNPAGFNLWKELSPRK